MSGKTIRNFVPLLLVLSGLAGGDTTFVWDNGGGDRKWSTSANWDPTGIPK